MHRQWIVTLVLLSIVVSACAPAPRAPAGEREQAAAPSAPKALTLAIQGEPKSLVPIMTGDIGGSPGGTLRMSLHQHLTTYDDRGQINPRLATELASQEKGTWVVNADGTMQTTYRLRPNVFWHDGTPLSTRDLAFAFTVTLDPELPVESKRTAQQISRVETPDDGTIIIHWNRTNPFASEALSEEDLGPLPRHVLQTLHESDKERFERSAYWREEYIGVGPYQLAEWQLGSHLVLKAFDRFFLGRPKIDTITVRFAADENAATAALLSGAVDGEFRILSFRQVMHARRQMEAAGRNPHVPIGFTYWRTMDVQYRPEYARPREVADLRVRRGLLHAIDRKTMAEILYDGVSIHSDTFIAPIDSRWDGVKDAVVQYNYDPRRAQELLAEAGWRRGSDGSFSLPNGERAVIPLWTTSGETWEHEMAITADNWKTIGVASEQLVIPTARARDRQTRASFPAFSSTATAREFLRMAEAAHGPDCPTEQTRWVGGNRGCYQNPSMDRLVDGLGSTIDPNEQQRLTRELVGMMTAELAVIPMYFHVQASIFREGVTGPTSDTVPPTSATWNAFEWDIK